MEDETLNHILNLLQNTNTGNTGNVTANNNFTSNNEMQNLLIKFLLSGGLTQIMNLRNQNVTPPPTPPTDEKPRTIDLTNYQRLD